MTELLGIARFRFKEGRRDDWLRLSDQAMELVAANEPDTLQYDIFLTADRSEAMVVERYRDSAAAMFHAANTGHLWPDVFATVELVHGELLGELSPELEERMAGAEAPVVFTPYRRMAR
jgi:quinol monooxygenase YgiN